MPVLEEALLAISRPDRAGSAGEESVRLDGLGDFARATWVATRPDTLGAATLVRLCQDSGFEPDVRFRSNNYGVLQGLVASSLRVALVPAIALDRRTDVVARAVDDPAARRRVSVVVSPSIPDDLARHFVGALRRAASRSGSVHVRVSEINDPSA